MFAKYINKKGGFHMKYNEAKMTAMEIQEELARYHLEELEKEEEQIAEAYRQIAMIHHRIFVGFLDGMIQLLEEREQARIKAEEDLCWREYYAIKQAEKDKAEFESAIYTLQDIPIKDEDVEAEIEQCIKEVLEDEKDSFVEMSEYKNPHNGSSYRRKQERRVKRQLVSKAIAADKSAAHRSKAELRRRRKTIKPQLLENEVGESKSHRVFRQYNWENKSRSARAKRLRKEVERFIPKLNDLSQKHLEEVWEKKAEAREAQLAARRVQKEIEEQTA